jgi:hypothetical protein
MMMMMMMRELWRASETRMVDELKHNIAVVASIDIQ